MGAASRILAFDTSGPWCGAALLIDGRIVAKRHEEMPRGQAERLMPMLEEVMAEEGAVWDELDAIGVGTGPGNFTGIRVGVSAARGLALGLGVPAVGVTAFEVVRHLLDGAAGRQIAVLPAPRDQWLWELAENGEAQSMGLAAKADFVCHAGYLEAPALIAADAPGSIGVYAIETFQFDCDAPATALSDMASKIAPAIAHLTAVKLASGAPIPRPAPLYIRPADAAPPSDPPPVILP